MRIVSLLPSATEIVFALGLGDQLCGVSFECDYPPQARSVPIVSGTVLPTDGSLSAHEIDAAIGGAVTGLRDYGYSWAEIGSRLGVTRQAAQQRWGAPR